MSRKDLTVALVLSLACVAGGTVSAQDPGLAPDSREAIVRVSAALEEIAASLRELHFEQKTLLVLRRIELAERRIEPLSEELRSARREVSNLNEQIAQMQSIAENFRTSIEASIRRGVDPLQIDEKSELEHIESLLEVHAQQLATAEQRVRDAEDEMARERRRIRILDDRLEEMLEMMGD